MGAEVPPRVSAASGPSSMGYVMKAMTRYDASDSYPPSEDWRSMIGNCRLPVSKTLLRIMKQHSQWC